MTKILLFRNDPKSTINMDISADAWSGYEVDDTTCDIALYLDGRVLDKNKVGRIKVAWLFEPKELLPHVFDYIVNNFREFDYIITWDKKLLEIDKRFVFMTFGFSFIADDHCKMYPKSKLLSIVASDKNFLVGHKMRHQVIARYKNQYPMGIYGRGYNPVVDLMPVFKDYMFTIAIENVARDWGFSEKLVTPIRCGSIPIYYGPDVEDFFDPRGMFTFRTIEEMDAILPTLSEAKYNEMLPYAQANFERSFEYKRTENNLYPLFKKLGII